MVLFVLINTYLGWPLVVDHSGNVIDDKTNNFLPSSPSWKLNEILFWSNTSEVTLYRQEKVKKQTKDGSVVSRQLLH